MVQSAWANTVEEALSRHGTDAEKGLTAAQVTKLRAEFGPNELDKEEGTPLWKLVLQQFDDLLVKILLGAATLSFVSARMPAHVCLGRHAVPPHPPCTGRCADLGYGLLYRYLHSSRRERKPAAPSSSRS
jgi:hypothetical protein